MTVEEALVKAGGFGRYQCFLLLIMILGNNGAGLIVYGVAYYELEPPYLCTYTVPQYVGHLPDNVSLAPQGFKPLYGIAENSFLYTVPCVTEVVCAHGRK